MKSKIKKLFFGVMLLAGIALFPMQSKRCYRSTSLMEGGQKRRVTFGDLTPLHQCVTAERLDVKRLTNDALFLDVNQKDRHGCTPLHHLMVHKDATVGLVDHFIAQGAFVYAINFDNEDPYHYAVVREDRYEDIDKSCFHNVKVVNRLHSYMVANKLKQIVTQQK